MIKRNDAKSNQCDEVWVVVHNYGTVCQTLDHRPSKNPSRPSLHYGKLGYKFPKHAQSAANRLNDYWRCNEFSIRKMRFE